MEMLSFSGRNNELSLVGTLLREVEAGSPRIVVLDGPPGSGRHRFLQQALTSSTRPPLHIHCAFNEGEDGLKVLLKLFGAAFATLHDQETLRESVRKALDAALVEATEPRKQWLTAFREGMEKDRPDLASPSFQVTIPRQSPYLALQEVLSLLASKHPIVLELSDPDHILSFAFWIFFVSLLSRGVEQHLPLLLVLSGYGLNETNAQFARALARTAIWNQLPDGLTPTRIALLPLSVAECAALIVSKYPSNRFPEPFAATMHRLSEGLPGVLLELLNMLEQREMIVQADDDSWLFHHDPTSLQLADIFPGLPDDNAAQSRQILQVAALEGRVFTARVISEQLALEKDVVDDCLDELDSIVEEVIFQEQLQSWLYRFKSPVLWRHYGDRLSGQARNELCQGLAKLLERTYVGRSADYAAKAARLWRISGEAERGASFLGLAASSERPDILQMGAEMIRTSPNVKFPAMLYKGLHLTLLEKVISTSPIDYLSHLTDEIDKWAKDHNETDLAPWIAFYRAKLFHRAGRLGEATKAAAEAQKGYARLNNAVKEADSFNILALIALSGGDPGMANEHIARAMRKSEFPPIRAQSLFVKGLIHKGRGEINPALEVLKSALEMSARVGNIPLHLDSGLSIAECLLVSGKPAEAVGLLKQLVDSAKATRQIARERGALSLMAKAEATLQDFHQAVECASAALKLAREMKARLFEAADLLDLGIFSMAREELDEASVYLRESEKLARDIKDGRLLREVLFHSAMVAAALKDHARALQLYPEALKLAKDQNEKRRQGNILFNMAGIYIFLEEFDRARTHLDQAAPLVEDVGNPEEVKALRKLQEQLELKIH